MLVIEKEIFVLLLNETACTAKNIRKDLIPSMIELTLRTMDIWSSGRMLI